MFVNREIPVAELFIPSPECIEITLPVIHFEDPALKHKSAEVVIPENSQVSEQILHSGESSNR